MCFFVYTIKRPPHSKSATMVVAVEALPFRSHERLRLNAPQRRYLRAFLQILARCMCIHLRSPLQQIIVNIGVVVAGKSDGAFLG